MKKLFSILFTLIGLTSYSQTIVQGKVTDGKNPLPFANISLQGTYDGASADVNGQFMFETLEKGKQVLSVSMIGFISSATDINLTNDTINIEVRLEESINSLNAVVVTAGMFEASDEKKMVMLKPMDIVTTAGGGADITSVMQLLPGATRVGEQEGLFVRGGSAQETKTVIDGMIVQNPFFSSTPDVPQRGRFNPFMFKGTAFSTGGYSAQYGQALSSVLLLNTMDKQGENSNINIGLNLAGVNASYTHKGWLTASVGYNNIAPFFALTDTNLDFETIPSGFGGSLTINEEFKNSTIKAYSTFTENQSAINLPSYDESDETYLFSNRNLNSFTNASYTTNWDEGRWLLKAGASYSNNTDQLQVSGFGADRSDERSQARVVMSRLYGKENGSALTFGAEYHHIKQSNIYSGYEFALQDNYSSIFVENEFYVNSKLALRLGLRAENSTVISKTNIAPRLSMAYKLGKYAQFSLAAGRFYQNPEKEYLYLNQSLDFEEADHAILNYQIIKNGKTFRTETFYKRYNNLVSEEVDYFDPNPYRFPSGSLDNSGYGYAKGFDIFFRDETSIPNGDFWITYSFLDTKRKFRNYTEEVVPHFATSHNVSLVYKQFFNAISTNIGATFTHTSGRPIYDFNEDFVSFERTKDFQNLSLMASHVKQVNNSFLVFYATLDNVLGRKNIFGYRYSSDGRERYPVKPLMYRTFFFGINWTIGQVNGRIREAELDF
ncbi:TonB-dependent receptor [Jiulongibacter sp. NS-SX5]|uniref:TonB-dependent receptor n=1 Tax=Jiulongibacter sp. NS-SX5 TaxID=3463854 RepID=UPI00405A0B6D